MCSTLYVLVCTPTPWTRNVCSGDKEKESGLGLALKVGEWWKTSDTPYPTYRCAHNVPLPACTYTCAHTMLFHTCNSWLQVSEKCKPDLGLGWGSFPFFCLLIFCLSVWLQCQFVKMRILTSLWEECRRSLATVGFYWDPENQLTLWLSVHTWGWKPQRIWKVSRIAPL